MPFFSPPPCFWGGLFTHLGTQPTFIWILRNFLPTSLGWRRHIHTHAHSFKKVLEWADFSQLWQLFSSHSVAGKGEIPPPRPKCLWSSILRARAPCHAVHQKISAGAKMFTLSRRPTRASSLISPAENLSRKLHPILECSPPPIELIR